MDKLEKEKLEAFKSWYEATTGESVGISECYTADSTTKPIAEKTYREKCVEFYKKQAKLEEDYEITEDNLNDYFVNQTACYMNCDKDTIKEYLLNK